MTRARDLAAFVSNADGDIKFDTDTLFIDSSANRVAIGNTAPSRPLHITANPAMILLEDSDGGSDDKKAQIQVDGGAFEVNARNDDDSSRTDNILVADLGNGNIGIGTNAPESGLHLFDGTNVGSPQNSSRKATLTIEAGSEGSADIQFLNASYNHIFFGDAADANIGYQVYDHTNNSMQFGVNAAERMRILAGGGITFNGDTAAANALDDYEEGTFTPTLKQSSSNPTSVTYDFQTGRYTKIGNLCFIMIDVGWSAITAGSGVAQITMPFAAVSGEYNAFTARSHTGISGLASGKVFSGYSGGSEINMQLVTLSTGQEGNAGWASSGRLNISGVIRTT